MSEVRRIAVLRSRDDGPEGRVPHDIVQDGFLAEDLSVTVPAPAPFNGLDATLRDLAYTEAGMRAAEGGAAAVLINTVGDSGLGQLRAVLGIPVVGAGQAAMHLAGVLGRRFSIVTVVSPASKPLYDRALAESGMGHACTEVRFVTGDDEGAFIPGGPVSAMQKTGRGPLLDRIVNAALDTLSAGAEVVVLGCTCMSPVSHEIAARLPCPTIDPLEVGYKTVETLVCLGLRHAAASNGPSDLSRALVRSLGRDAVGVAQELGVADDDCGDSCSVLAGIAAAPSALIA
jgi:allantoin racemase